MITSLNRGRATKKIVLLGSGTLTANLAHTLRSYGHNVLATTREDPGLWSKQELDEADAASADLIIAATARDDSNLVLALAGLKIYGKRAIAVVVDPCKAEAYRKQPLTLCA